MYKKFLSAGLILALVISGIPICITAAYAESVKAYATMTIVIPPRAEANYAEKDNTEIKPTDGNDTQADKEEVYEEEMGRFRFAAYTEEETE